MTGRITRAPRVEYDSVCSSLCVCGIFLDRLRLYRETEANVLRCHAQSGTQFCRRPCFGLISLNLMLVYRVCFLRCVQLQFVYVSVCEAEICDFSRTVVTIANVADFCQPAINSPNCSLPLSLSLVPWCSQLVDQSLRCSCVQLLCWYVKCAFISCERCLLCLCLM